MFFFIFWTIERQWPSISGLCFAGVLINFRSGKFQVLDVSFFSKGHAGFFGFCCRVIISEFWTQDISDDDGIPEGGYCYDDRGVCDRFPHLQNDRFFTVKLEETFDVCTLCNDKHFIVINIITCASFVQRVIYGIFFNSTSTSRSMLDHMYCRSLVLVWMT